MFLDGIFLDGSFDLITFLSNVTEYLQVIGKYLLFIIGIVMIIVAIYQIAKGLAGGGRGQVNWVSAIVCLLIGGALLAGGWSLATSLAATGANTIEELGSADYKSPEDALVQNDLSSYGNS